MDNLQWVEMVKAAGRQPDEQKELPAEILQWTVLVSGRKVSAQPVGPAPADEASAGATTSDAGANPPQEKPVRPIGLWTPVCDFVAGPVAIKIEAKGTWTYSTRFGKKCTADGDILAPVSNSKAICTKCPIGALIAKIGGSSADTESGGSNVHPVGSFAVLVFKDTDQGALFLAINDLWNGWQDNAGELEVTISVADLPKSATS